MPAFTRERESKKRSQRAVQRCSTFQPIVQTSTPSNNSLPNSNPSCARSPPILSRASHSPWTACARPSSLASTKSHEQNAPHISPIQDMGNLNGKRSNRRLQPLRYLHDCSDCFRLERLPGGACTHWKAPPLHGAHPCRTSGLNMTGHPSELIHAHHLFLWECRHRPVSDLSGPI